MKRELKILAALVAYSLWFYALPLGNPGFRRRFWSVSLASMVRTQSSLACVGPGVVHPGPLLRFGAKLRMRYLGPRSNQSGLRRGAVAGCVLAGLLVRVLPMFAAFTAVGAGWDLPTAFLYSAPDKRACHFLSARCSGFRHWSWQVIGAVVFSVVMACSCSHISQGRASQAKAAFKCRSRRTSPHISQTATVPGLPDSVLIFSDWVQPGQRGRETTDGRELGRVIMKRRHDSFSLNRDLGRPNRGQIELPKTASPNHRGRKRGLSRSITYAGTWRVCAAWRCFMAWRWLKKMSFGMSTTRGSHQECSFRFVRGFSCGFVRCSSRRHSGPMGRAIACGAISSPAYPVRLVFATVD